MKRITLQMVALLLVIAFSFTASQANGQELPKAKDSGSQSEKLHPASLAKLIEQLGSSHFKLREEASKKLALLEEVPTALREALKNSDPEVARRAQTAIDTIVARIEKKALEALPLDQLVRRMVREKKFAGDQQWERIQTIANAVIDLANKQSGRKYEVSDIAMKTKSRELYNRKTVHSSATSSALLSAGPTPYMAVVLNSIVIVDGDFTGATSIRNSLLIVRGNVGQVVSITGSIILATGNFDGGVGLRESFLQVNNDRIWYPAPVGSVVIKSKLLTGRPTNSRDIYIEQGPLQLLKFSPRKSDGQLVWGKAVNNLAMAIAPTDEKDQILIRWKNVGKEALEVPWIRLIPNLVDESSDDLINHVFLKGVDNKLVPARKYPCLTIKGKESIGGRTVIIGPSQTIEETIDLWNYLDKPTTAGNYQLSIETNPPGGGRGTAPQTKSWSGTIRSNVLDVRIEK